MAKSFPIYCKLQGGGHLYRIESDDRFTELQRVGSRWVKHKVVASMYPEMVRIAEMIDGGDGTYATSTKEEWDSAEIGL